jgi:hypothetical protein
VVRRLGTWIGILLVSGSIGCLLYTQPVNEAPMIISITVPTQLVRNVQLTFQAEVKDDQSSPLAYAWGLVSGACPDGNALPPGASPTDTSTILETMLHDLGDHCVFLTVTDEHGATDHRTMTFQIVDLPPGPIITRVDPVDHTPLGPIALTPLYSDVRFTADASIDPDGDALTYAWTLTLPSQTQGMTPPACDDAPSDVCFNVSVPGSYTLAVTADDGHGMTTTKTVSFMVDIDRPPCIVETEPHVTQGSLVADPAKPLTFKLDRVADDGDPLPPTSSGGATFAWSVRLAGATLFTRKIASTDLPFEIPAGTYPSGQQLEVRVEAFDRRLTQCDPNNPVTDPAVCRSDCSQWVTWSVEFR